MTIMTTMTETHLKNIYYKTDNNDNNDRHTYITHIIIITIMAIMTKTLI